MDPAIGVRNPRRAAACWDMMSPRSPALAADLAPPRDGLSPVRSWLWLTILLTFVMITIGGATRLTGSGLSITEWRPVTGAIPPLGLADWMAEFEKYRQSSQYALLNKGMTLDEFQFIYWWEWGHRQLGRLIGLVYLLGFVWVAATRRVSVRATILLFMIGLLLAAQGAVGWIMVASGLKPGMVAVEPVKLTLHLMFASVFLASLVAVVVAMTEARGGEGRAPANLIRSVWICLIALLLQIALGGLVAGARAGLIYTTWPLIDGGFFPPLQKLFFFSSLTQNLTENPLFMQVFHRLGAYFLLLLVALHLMASSGFGAHPSFRRRAVVIAALVLAQGAIGVATLVHAVPLALGLAHQAAAMVLLAMLTVHLARAHGWRAAARAH